MAHMLDFRERTKLRRALYAKPTIIILGLLTALVGRGAYAMYQKSQEAIANRDKAEADLLVLETRKKELDLDIARLSSVRGQEGEVRDRFMVAKEGEKVIIVADPAETKNTAHTVVVSEEEPTTFMDKVKSAVGVSGQ